MASWSVHDKKKKKGKDGTVVRGWVGRRDEIAAERKMVDRKKYLVQLARKKRKVQRKRRDGEGVNYAM